MHNSIKMVNGDYVIHFLQLLTKEDNDKGLGYPKAIANAKPFGGRKLNNKSYGGGIAFNYLSEAENALEHVTGMFLCSDCKNDFVYYKGDVCLACEQRTEEVEKEKDAQRQADREKYNQLDNVVFVHVMDWTTGKATFHGQMAKEEALKLEGHGKTAVYYKDEKYYNHIKTLHEAYLKSKE